MNPEQRRKISESVKRAWAKRRPEGIKRSRKESAPSIDGLPVNSHFGEDTFALLLQDVKNAPELLSREGEVELFQEIERGNREAFDRVVAANLRLVISVATKRFRGRGLEDSDLVQNGCLGLIRAVEKFDWRKGFKFSTYATVWIRQAIGRMVSEESQTIRLPVHMTARLYEMSSAEAKFRQKFGRDPTYQELAKAMKRSPKRVRDLLQIGAIQPISLNQPITDKEPDEQMELEDILHDPTPPITDAVEDKLSSETIRLALRRHLTPMERRVITRRFGLSGKEPMTLDEITRVLRLPSSGITRALETSALKKLRHPSIAKALMVDAL